MLREPVEQMMLDAGIAQTDDTASKTTQQHLERSANAKQTVIAPDQEPS